MLCLTCMPVPVPVPVPVQLADVVAVALETGVAGLIVSNTTLARPSSLASPHKGEVWSWWW
jgi:dihydroorotate dehydrogenase